MSKLADDLPAFSRLYERARAHDLLPRGVLDDESRHAVCVAALVILRLEPGLLEEEIGALLDAGCPPGLAEDVVVQMAAYCGYPAAAGALRTLARARRARGLPGEDGRAAPTAEDDESRYARGTADYARLNPEALATIRAAFDGLAPDLANLTFRAFGDVYARSRLALPVRQVATVAALATMGTAAPQLRFHIGTALHVGVTREALVETIYWVQFFAGMPAAYNALIELKAALADGPATPGYR